MSKDTRTLTIREHTTSTAHRLLRYDGVCNAVHGHNMEWNIELEVEVPDTDDKMALDFKDANDIVDKYDHAILLNEDDPLLEIEVDNGNNEPFQSGVMDAGDLLGEYYTFEHDPTCEHITEVVAEEYLQLDGVLYARVELAETDKYAMTNRKADEYTAEFEADLSEFANNDD